MIVTVPASLAVIEFYNHDHAKDGSGKFSKDNGAYRKGAGSSASRPGANKGSVKKVAESGKYDDSGNEHVGTNVADNANRQRKEIGGEVAAKAAHGKAEADKFTKVANQIAKRDGITPSEAAKRLGNLLKTVKEKNDAKKRKGPK